MSEAAQKRRNAVLAWLLRRDTVLLEFGLACTALLNALQVYEHHRGEPLAPFLFSALRWLDWNDGTWALLLSVMSVFKLGALVLGLASGNTFFLRGIVSLLASLMWTAVAVAIFTGAAHPLTGARYALAAFLSWSIALILLLRHDMAQEEKRRLSQRESVERENGGVDTREERSGAR